MPNNAINKENVSIKGFNKKYSYPKRQSSFLRNVKVWAQMFNKSLAFHREKIALSYVWVARIKISKKSCKRTVSVRRETR